AVIARGMGVALYAMFIAILIPGVKRTWINGLVAAAGACLAWGASFVVPRLPPGWRIVIAILAASAIGAAVGGAESGSAASEEAA
ncbi:MAG TPA: hypothetical protein VFB30_08830, partial [Spirochaetia bacterium]|nr:hypothetical protein [Spirochaetia bacterium]